MSHIDLTNYNAMLDDDGSNTTGTMWNKTLVASVVLTPVEAGFSVFVAASADVCDGRLTLTSALPVTTADVTAATSIYFTPYKGKSIALYSGTAWVLVTFTERTLALGTLSSGKPYDVFAYSNAGVVTLEALAWTNDTTRATALVRQDGVLVKTGALTRRYLGTFYTTSTTTTEDSVAKRFLWNYHHRVRRQLKIADATASWSYNTATIRQVRATTTNKVEAIVGVAEVSLSAWYSAVVTNDAASVQPMQIGVGLDSTTGYAANSQGHLLITGPTATMQLQGTAHAEIIPAAGYHYLAALEKGTGTGTTTWYGTGTYPGSATLLAWLEG